MPYSFTHIEKDKTRTIGLVFSFLIVFYFGVFWLIALLIKNFVLYDNASYQPAALFVLNWRDSMIVFALAMLVGYGHWSYSVSGLVEKVARVLRAEPLNPADRYHQQLQNIIDEVCVATGGGKIEGRVIPTTAMNAFALMDFEGRRIIGVTEGLLARLTRAQLEAVIGHEAAHIVSGDCLATTVTTSMFALYSGFLKGLERFFGEMRFSRRRGGSGGGGIIALLLAIYILLWISRGLSHLMRMFISRQREYRADAIAVRLTRDPLSLAEALYTIACRWRGSGLAAEELESIFIVNPAYAAADEKAGWFADLFSTHPPFQERLRVLLDMAHTDLKTLAQSVEQAAERPRVPAPVPGSETAAPPLQWMVHRLGAWQGPFDFAQLRTLEGLQPETWVQRPGAPEIKMAYEDQDLMHALNNKSGPYQCPKCKISLTPMTYEGVEVNACPFCHGLLVAETDVSRIIIRREVGFSERIIQLANKVREEGKIWRDATIKRDPKTLLVCPKCPQGRGRMMRMFYTAAYHVEIDKCLYCGSLWFDKNEMEILQCLIETQTNKVMETENRAKF